MKKLFLFFLIVFLGTPTLWAQSTPYGMKYQAVARSMDGQLIANQSLSVQITLLSGGHDGEALYQEIHDVVSNDLGLFNLVIGRGDTKLETNFSSVPWDEKEVWLEIALDEDGGRDFVTLGASQLLAVPYAMHAQSATRLSNGQTLEKGGNTGNTWKVGGNIFNVPGPHNIGTLEAVDLVFITSNITRLTITADGDINIENSLSIGEDLDVGGDTRLEGTLGVNGIARFSNTTQSTNKDNGAVIIEGGVGIEKNVNIGQNTDVTGNFNVDGLATASNTAESTSTSTGSLVVSGGTGITKNLNVGGNGDVDGNLNVDGVATASNTAQSTSTATGSLVVSGGTGIAKNLNVGGNGDVNGTLNVGSNTDVGGTLKVAGTSDLDGQVTISKYFAADQDNYDAYPLRVEGADQGVAIKVNGTGVTRNTNWLTLFDETGAPQGRIEGFQGLTGISGSVIEALLANPSTDEDDYNSDPTQGVGSSAAPNSVAQYFNNDYSVGALSLTLGFVGATITLASSFGSILDPEDIFSEAVGFAVAIIDLGGYIAYNELNLGASFESGGADYAEWLQKANSAEVLNFGEVVGIRGGMVSRTFTEAERFMIVSSNPTILGAMPDPGKEGFYEKIAFMGQVPVKTIGVVSNGDYILPSGNGDGMAIAVPAEAMRAKDFARAVGIAWGESDGKQLFSYVNVAVGINVNDLANTVDRMQNVINEMQKSLQKLDPAYNPEFFDASGTSIIPAVAYTTAPSLSQVAGNGTNIETLEDVTDYITHYTAAQGIDLSKYPHIQQLLANPQDASVRQATIDHYSRVLSRLQGIMSEVGSGG